MTLILGVDHQTELENAAQDYSDYLLQEVNDQEEEVECEIKRMETLKKEYQSSIEAKIAIERKLAETTEKHAKITGFVTFRNKNLTNLKAELEEKNQETTLSTSKHSITKERNRRT